MYATQQSARKNEISTNLLSYVSTYKRQLFLQMHGIINLVPKNPQNENDFVCRKCGMKSGGKQMMVSAGVCS